MINIVLHTGEGLTTRPSTISCAHNPLAPLHTTTYDFQVKLTDMSLLDMQIRIRGVIAAWAALVAIFPCFCQEPQEIANFLILNQLAFEGQETALPP